MDTISASSIAASTLSQVSVSQSTSAPDCPMDARRFQMPVNSRLVRQARANTPSGTMPRATSSFDETVSIGHRQRFPEQDAAILALRVQAVEKIEAQHHGHHEEVRSRESPLRERKQRAAALRVEPLSPVDVQIEVDASPQRASQQQPGDHQRRHPQDPVLPELAAYEGKQSVARQAVGGSGDRRACRVCAGGAGGRTVHAATSCILATNKSAMDGVRISPSGPSSLAERPSNNMATRPNTSRW